MDIRMISRILYDWGVRAFGKEHMDNHPVRALRAAEEMVELNQAIGVPREKLHLLVDIVYDRPAGDVSQEMGGSMVTLMMLAWSLNLKLDVCLENELLRCLSKHPAHFAVRNEDKLKLGLT